MLLYLLLAILVALFASSYILLDFQPQSYSVPLPTAFDGALSVNDRLNKLEKLFEGQLIWPESLAAHEGSIYTGISDGNIVQITGDKLTPIIRIGKDCDGSWQENICGRPLGMKFDKKGYLHVMDAYHGYHVVDVKKGIAEQILPSFVSVNGKRLMFVNDLVLDEENGLVYFTQSSTKWQLDKVLYSIIEHDTSGRLVRYDPRANESTVLLDNLAFPNGIVLSHDGMSVIIAEGNNHRVLRYYIKGTKAGHMDVLIQNLPGEPDNVRRSKKGGYWIALNSARTTSTPTLYDRLSSCTISRKILMHTLHSIGSGIEYVAHLLPFPAFKAIAFEIATGRFMVDILPAHGLILEVNENGQILQSLHSPDGQISHISEVLEHNGNLYLGSWRNHYLGRIKL